MSHVGGKAAPRPPRPVSRLEAVEGLLRLVDPTGSEATLRAARDGILAGERDRLGKVRRLIDQP